MSGGAEKTEKPTPRRLKQARKEGQFPRTPDAAAWVGIAAGSAMLPTAGGLLMDRFRTLNALVPAVVQNPEPARVLDAVTQLPLAVLVSAGPVCLAALTGAVLATAVQGTHLTGKTLKPKFSRLSPKQGLKRMVGGHAAWEAVKSVTKVGVLAVAVWVLGKAIVPELVAAGPLPLGATVQRVRGGMQTLIWTMVVVGLLLALADYAYQRRTVMKQLRMSLKDIKDEMRQTEGDPMLKGAIRARQMAISRNRMLSAVATADVVLVNPTHYAVALTYEPGRGAPKVVAKGAGVVAAKIRERARRHRVPLVEDPPLTRSLYRVCGLGDEIPAELYLAVAQILAFVMSVGRPGRSTPAHRPAAASAIPHLPSRSALRARRARENRAARRS
jgi:flagellar biosynthesis protein FlhB